MFLHDFCYVDLPVAKVCRQLGNQPEAWLSELAGDAVRQMASLGGADSVAPAPDGHVETGPLRCRGETVALALVWVAPAGDQQAPRIAADLEVAPVAGERSQLTLLGRYEPLGPADRPAGSSAHRHLEATARVFLNLVAERLAAEPDLPAL